MVTDAKTGEKAGVAYQLGQALAQRLGVPVQIVEFPRPALVAEAVKSGAVDFTFTNASEARARQALGGPMARSPSSSPADQSSRLDRSYHSQAHAHLMKTS